jgi:hypothetical protein
MGHWPTAATVFNRSTLWCPQPEIASQLISALLLLWCEVPWSTEFAVLIPRVLQGNWGTCHATSNLREFVLDKIANTAESRWHREQANFLRGL